MSSPKILVLDIETAPILAYVWGLWENDVALNQIKSDWYVLSWAAKWLDSHTVMYMDQRNERVMEDDTKLLKGMWKLLDEADIVVTHNGKQFDIKKLHARFLLKNISPPKSFKNIDTLVLAKKHFGFTSNKLEYLSDKLCTKYKKLKHDKFSGFELWKECLLRNKDAWKEMEKYNKHDVLSLEELYKKMRPWDNTLNFDVYSQGNYSVCSCGSKEFVKCGFAYTTSGKYQVYKCVHCGHQTRDKSNNLDLQRRKSLRVNIVR